MSILLRILDYLTLTLLSGVILLSPWMLGAWEMWYFWPLAVVLFAAVASAGLRWSLTALLTLQRADDPPRPGLPAFAFTRYWILIAAWAPFLVYATARFLQTPVVMDAERIWLLIVTPALLITAIVLQFNVRQARRLFLLIAISMALQAVYGFVAFYIYDDQYVMWVPNIFGYPGRMKGSYFCPNHFSGYLEMGFCMALAVILERSGERSRRIAAIPLLVLTLAGVGLSLSRGGWMTIAVVIAAALVWGLVRFSRRQAWLLRGGIALLVILTVMLLLGTDNPARRRLYYWPPFNPDTRDAEKTLVENMLHRVQFTSRGKQINGALRAWRTAPIWGIGPGMHQNVWFQFADSGDGNRETGEWPTQSNHTFHSYEVHSDWVQLLQELGLVGFGLFLVGFGVLSITLVRGIRTAHLRDKPITLPLAAWLSVVAIAFHSLGDFNLQIPANTWTLAALIGLGLVAIPIERPQR